MNLFQISFHYGELTFRLTKATPNLPVLKTY